MASLKLVFCGTPRFAVPTLEALLHAGHDVELVISQPDKPVGRGQMLTAPPVKQTAIAAGVPVTQPDRIRNNAEFRAQLETIAPDAIVVVAYGRIIPPWMLALPRLGCINLHGSLLPKYRGAAPIQWAVACGETVTGNTTMLLEEGLDTGPTLLRQELSIAPAQTAADLFDILARAGAPLMVETLAGLADGSVKPKPQDHSLATLAPLLGREDGRMDFELHTAKQLKDRWRGFQPWPGAFTRLDGKKLIVHRLDVADEGQGTETELAPGQIHVADTQLFVACARGTWLELLEVQLEGKRRLSAAEFLRGAQLSSGALLG
jgi:methionyl-tRNA formyltransferase